MAAAFFINVASAIADAAIPVFDAAPFVSLDVDFATAATALIDVFAPAVSVAATVFVARVVFLMFFLCWRYIINNSAPASAK